MAKIEDGINGPLRGSVGNVTASSWNGIRYIKSKPAQVNNPNTPAQKKQRGAFKLVTQTFGPLRPFINHGFTDAVRMTPMNRAVQYAMKNAVRLEDDGETPVIHWPSVRMGEGDLPAADDMKAELSTENSELIISWNPNAISNSARDSDELYVLAFFEGVKHGMYSVGKALRSDGQFVLPIPTNRLLQVESGPVHVFAGFSRPDNSDRSPASYISTASP